MSRERKSLAEVSAKDPGGTEELLAESEQEAKLAKPSEKCAEHDVPDLVACYILR